MKLQKTILFFSLVILPLTESTFSQADLAYPDYAQPYIQPAGVPEVRMLRATAQGDHILLQWQDPPSAAPLLFLIYRGKKAIKEPNDLATSEFVAKFQMRTGYFVDKDLYAGSYYYAIVTVDQYGNKSKGFLPGFNVLANPVDTRGDTKESTLPESRDPLPFRLSVYPRKDAVFLAWDNVLENIKNLNLITLPGHKLLIYRFTRAPMYMNDLQYGELIARLASNLTLYEDVPPRPGRFYYVIFLETQNGMFPQKLDSNLAGPVFYRGVMNPSDPTLDEGGFIISDRQKELRNEFITPQILNDRARDLSKIKKTENSERINQVINETYLRGNYTEAINQLRPLIEETRDKAKIFFYLGLSYHKAGRYEEALEYFVRPAVVRSYKNKAKFWYQRTLEHIK